MAELPPDHSAESARTRSAGDWLARRDRGLSPAEQDAFLQWLQDDPRHRSELARLDRTWAALDVLTEWRPAHSTRPNPDLLVPNPRRVRPRFWISAGILAAAASLALGAFLFQRTPAPGPATAATLRVIPAPERVQLEDGTTVEANRGGVFETAFTRSERRVRLVSGEAHFTVAPNAARPFIVETAAGVVVRAVGTAFNVRCADQLVDVLVTEGRVQIESPVSAKTNPTAQPAPTALAAGQQASVDVSQPSLPPVVTTLTPAQIEHRLAWQAVRLVFDELPLSAVVAEFNLRNRQQLVIADPRIASLRVAGSFRADNVEAFSRLLEASFGVVVERRADGTLGLRRAD